ncbi:MAG: hypothetical protein K0R57_4116 [Paenibacillaceae bacterium]|jgi:putative aldouronate transport system substrate-binding protein|nr:hypothetical protein [Paenibacillaceae bacterium]
MKKTVFFLLTLGITATLAACSGQESGSTPEPAQSQGQPAVEKPRGKLTAAIYDRGNVPASEGTATNNRWLRWIKENAPVDPEFIAIPRWESVQKYNTLFASNSAPDLIMEYDRAYRNQLYSQKQLLPLDELIDKHSTEYKALLEKYPALRKIGTMPDGKLYEVGLILGNAPGINHQLWIRKDWLDALNLGLPATAEELYKVAEAFAKQDPDKNGKADTYGINISFVGGMIVDFMFGNVFTIYDKSPWVLDDSGNLVHDWERKAASITFKKRLYDNGIVDKDFLTDGKGDRAKQDFINGKLGMFGSNGSDLSAFRAFKEMNPQGELVALALPETEFGSFSPVVSAPFSTYGVVNAKAKDPEAVIRYLDFLHKQTTSNVLRNGFEGEHYTLDDRGCPTDIDAAKNNTERVYAPDIAALAPLTEQFQQCDAIRNPPAPKNPTPKDEAEYKLQKEFAQLILSADKAYVDPERPMAGVIPASFLPSMPQDLQINQTNGYKAVLDFLQKSIVSGSSYSVEKAVEDARNAWKMSNGSKIDEWYEEWYRSNKDTAVLVKDLYTALK